MKKIKELTGLSDNQYETLLISTLLTCLGSVAKSQQHLQLLLQNKAINKWFLTQVKKVNKEYVKSIEPYKYLPKLDLLSNYKSTLIRVTLNYPSALINKTKPNNPLILNN